MEDIIKNFEKNQFTTKFFEKKEQVVEYIKSQVKDTVVSFGGSETCRELGLYEILKENNVVTHHAHGDEYNQTPNVYISSANALTKDGKIVNIDGRGNRVSATIYGPEKVYIICGVNKICDNLEQAIHRAQNIASPLNARRLNKKTPCSVGEIKCHDCNSPDRICRTTAIMTKKTGGVESFEVIIVNENIGY